MNIVEFNSLIPSAVAIQPHLAWMLATVPGMIQDEATRERVTSVLEDLNLKFAKLNGEIIELETSVQAFEPGDVLLVGNGELITVSDNKTTVNARGAFTVECLSEAEETLREALAEIIVTRGELEIQQEELDKIMKVGNDVFDAFGDENHDQDEDEDECDCDCYKRGLN